MINLLIDSCVWLDIPKDPAQQTTLAHLDNLITLGEVSLIVPQTVLTEIARNKQKIITGCGRGVSEHIKQSKNVAARIVNVKDRNKTMQQLHNLDLHLPFLEEAANDAFKAIESLLSKASIVPASNEIMVRAAQRAVEGKAPFHLSKNSINDAILIETYIEAMKNGGPGQRYAFVTHNVKDFSHRNVNDGQPHPDLAPLFTKIKSRYFVSLVDALRRIRPDIRAQLNDEMNWTEEVRTAKEIMDAISELIDKVWYNRHKVYEEKIQEGEVTLVDTYNPKNSQKECVRSVWEGALKSAKKVEVKYGGPENLVWDDFEWGMLNGKLSALRWVFGDEWDSLYT